MGKLVFIAFAAFALAFGYFIYKNPKQTFRLQQKFYSLINWNIEPISMEKEIRNTKIMGICLILFVLACGLYVCFH